ncbi:MAG: hypothetical protein E7508_08110 [Ruminococcus sp.]|nr:hypothetical protein [Ruminococcus sp.]
MFFAVKIYADEYDKDYIESLSSLPKYETSFVPIKLSEPSDFSNDLVNCINVNGELYHISLEYMEKYDGWDDIKKDILSVMDFDNLRIDSYEELRNMIPFGVCVDEYGRNPSPLYQISDDIIILEDYHCKYDKSGNLYHMTTKDEFIGYRICNRLSSDILYKSCWYESDGFKYYIDKNGMPTTKNRTIGGIRYVFNKYGQCQGKYTGWTKSASGRRYYKNGVMLKERWLKTKSGKKYYAGEDGYMRTGWYRVADGWCYFDDKNGQMATGDVKINGNTYTFSADGIWNGLADYDNTKIYNTLSKKLSKDDYGGIYLDKNAVVVMSKNVSAVKKLTDELKKLYAPIVVKECNYSVNELETVKKHLDKNQKKYGISAISTDVKNNRISVEMKKSNSKLNAYLDTLDDDNIVRIEYTDVVMTDD